MALVPFKYYLQDDYTYSERMAEISEQVGIDIDPDGALAMKIGNPFYEVALDCLLNTETGEVTLVSASL